MDPNWILAALLRVLHIGLAIVTGGAAFFQLFGLRPALRDLPDEQRAALRERIADRWRPIVLVSIALLLFSGLLTYVAFKIPEYQEHEAKGLYHALLGLKLLAALLVFHAAGMLVLPGSKGRRIRARAGFWLKYGLTLLAVVIVLGALLRNFPADNA